MTTFASFDGIVTMINDFPTRTGDTSGCYKLMTLQDQEVSVVNFVVSPSTYFADNETIKIGDAVVGFYDALAPVPLIYPPQYQAIVMSKLEPGKNITVDYFNYQLVSSDGTLKLNIAPYTKIILENNQTFTQNPANRNLTVVYGPTTRSIPAQTTPYQIIVMCPDM